MPTSTGNRQNAFDALPFDVVVEGRIPGMDAIGPLGSALCIATAWGPGELQEQLPRAGFSIDRRWDRTGAILELIDRVEARATLLRLAARDLGLDLQAILPLVAPPGLGEPAIDPGAIRRAAETVRAAVRRGELRYVAVVATAI